MQLIPLFFGAAFSLTTMASAIQPQAEKPTAWAPQAEKGAATPQAEKPSATATATLTASITASTCAANGAVTATVTGINVSEWDITYGLNPVDEGGAIFARQTAATIEHVPPGNYVLTAELVGRSGTAKAGQAQRLRSTSLWSRDAPPSPSTMCPSQVPPHGAALVPQPAPPDVWLSHSPKPRNT